MNLCLKALYLKILIQKHLILIVLQKNLIFQKNLLVLNFLNLLNLHKILLKVTIDDTVMQQEIIKESLIDILDYTEELDVEVI